MAQANPGRRAQRRKARIDEILDAAMEEIVASGWDSMTVGKLAKRLDYTPGALYRYFSSKDVILAELQVRIIQDVHESLLTLWEATAEKTRSISKDVSSLVDLVAAADLYRELNDQLPRRSQLIRVALSEPRPLVDEDTFRLVMMPAARLLDDIARRFDMAVDVGALESGNALERAVVLWTSVQGATSVGKLGRFGDELFAPRRLAENLIRALLIGWGATAEKFAEARTIANSLHGTINLVDTVGLNSTDDQERVL